MRGLERVTFDPKVMVGQACIRGMRIPVSLIINLLARGKQVEEILEEYPDLERDDIQQALEASAQQRKRSLSGCIGRISNWLAHDGGR